MAGVWKRWEVFGPSDAAEAEAECRSLARTATAARGVVNSVTCMASQARSAEQAREIAALGAEAPAQAVGMPLLDAGSCEVRRLQGEVALLESKVLEQQAPCISRLGCIQAVQVAAARKAGDHLTSRAGCEEPRGWMFSASVCNNPL